MDPANQGKSEIELLKACREAKNKDERFVSSLYTMWQLPLMSCFKGKRVTTLCKWVLCLFQWFENWPHTPSSWPLAKGEYNHYAYLTLHCCCVVLQCYYIGAMEISATKLVKEVIRPLSFSKPVEKICEDLKKKDSQICELRYGEPKQYKHTHRQ